MKWCLLKYRLLEGKLPRTIQAEFVAAYAHPAPRVTQPRESGVTGPILLYMIAAVFLQT